MWLEEAEAGLVAGVLGLANLAPSYAGARALFVDVLDVRRQLDIDELPAFDARGRNLPHSSEFTYSLARMGRESREAAEEAS